MNILDYNKSLDQYNAKKNAITYNNVLTVADKMRQQGVTPGGGVPQGGGGGGGAAPAGGGGGGIDPVALAELARRNRIDSYKAQAGNLRSSAQMNFDNIMKAVADFRNRSTTLRDDAGQEIVNRASETEGANARMAVDTAGQARARGRSLGLGDSSKFINQNKVAGNLAAAQGSVLARQGEEDRSNSALFQERQDQAADQERQAGTYRQSVNDRAAALENTGYDAAEETYAGALNDIVNYQRSLAQINPVSAGGLTQYTPNFSGISNNINSVLSGLGGGSGSPSAPADYGNPVNPTNVFDLLKRKGIVN